MTERHTTAAALPRTGAGIGIGICGESFFAGNMVGWDDDSIGWHPGDGKFYYKTAENEERVVPLETQTPCRDGDILGCGVLFESDKPTVVYFCLNKEMIGRFPLRSEDSETLFPVVSGCSPAIVQINLAAQNPQISNACILKTFAYTAKYRDESKKWSPVTIQGPTNESEHPVTWADTILEPGVTPVAFMGYGDTVLIPRHRLNKTEKNDVFSTLEQAFNVAVNGDTIEVKQGCGVNLMRDSIEVSTDITVRGPSDLSQKPTISLWGGFVFTISRSSSMARWRPAKVSLQNIAVHSVCGDKSKKHGAVVMHDGSLSIASCCLASENGLGLLVHEGHVEVKECTVKNCVTGVFLLSTGRHYQSPATVTVRDSSVSNCSQHAVYVETSAQCIASRTVILKDCTIDNCKVGVHSEGEKSTVSYNKNTSFNNCNDKQKVANGGKFVAETVEPLLQVFHFSFLREQHKWTCQWV